MNAIVPGRLSAFLFVLCLLPGSAGCSSHPGPEIRLPIDEICSESHDFGTVIDAFRILNHVFTLSNVTDNTVHLLEATAFTPCCSGFGKLPREIPPHGQVEIPVYLKIGPEDERKSVILELVTDHLECKGYQFTLKAQFLTQCNIKLSDETPIRVAAGASRVVRIMAAIRHAHSNVPQSMPKVTLSGPGRIKAIDRSLQGRTDDLDESLYQISLQLDAGSVPGHQSATVVADFSSLRS